jgi:sulfofructose kinase
MGHNATMQSNRVIVIGHSALDRVYRIPAFPPKPTKVRALEHIESGGGTAANAAAAVAKLGGGAELWSRVGDDETGQKIRRSLDSAGVDTSQILVHDGAKTPTATVIVDAAGERMVVSEDDHVMPMDADWLPLDHINSAGAVLSDLSWLEGTIAAFKQARTTGVPTLLDVDLGGGPLLAQIVHLTDYVILSAPAFERFTAGTGREDRLAGLIAGGAHHAGVTQGAKGYTWRGRDGRDGHQEAFAVDVVDTTGAGDAFHGAFALSIATGCSDDDSARMASAVAALKCRRLGARAGLPTASELDAFLSERTGRGVAERFAALL